ncbi:MAG: carbohydrate kinase family protein [Chlorobi bacterium]|nr:carbohydrate kinase family protein [Chlorobiota bacterium]MCI0715251.1 carbohydrate kinase family protein [Chlorobiota bacterium]
MKTLPNGTRKQFQVSNWFEWCSLCDSLQMNESEIEVLTGDNLSEEQTTRDILNRCNVKSIVVTKGKQGASLYETEKKSKNGNVFNIRKTNGSSIENNNFADSTGCGDVFASAFFFRNIINNFNFKDSLVFANKMAGLNVKLNGVEELGKLNEGA